MSQVTKICSVFLVAVFVLLHGQPLLSHQVEKRENTCAGKSSCSKQKPAKKEKDCNTDKGCNPFVPCSIGSCSYLVESFYIQPLIVDAQKKKNVLANDNTLQSAISECWQPPETKS